KPRREHSTLDRWTTATAAFIGLIRNADDGEAAKDFVWALDGRLFERWVKELEATPDGRVLLDRRPTLNRETLDPAALERLPDGTLGRELARYCERGKIEPFSPAPEATDVVDYVLQRGRETHDIMHVVTGYGADPLGELELQAFQYGNLGNPSAAFS